MIRVLATAGTVGAGLALLACGPSGPPEGSCQDDILPGSLVITEVFADYKAPPGGAGTDEGKEWLEVFNASDRPIELEGMTIVHSRPDGSKENLHVMEKVTIAPGQFLTLGNSVADLLPAYIDYGYSADLGDFYNSDGGKLVLRCGDDEVDAAEYNGINEGRSRQLTAGQPPDYTLNDDQLNWCEANSTEFDTGNFGTPGSDSDCTPVIVGQCSDGSGMRDTIAPAAGDLVITELLPNGVGTAAEDEPHEWFEVFVKNDVDLNGVGIDRLNTTTAPDIIESPDCIRVTAGSYVVIARSMDPGVNGNLPSGAVLATFTKTSLVQGSSSSPGDLQLLANGAAIDVVTWTGSRDGKSISLDPDNVDATANDNVSNFCDGTALYNGIDAGTPGAVNAQCGGQQTGMCNDNGAPRPIVKPAAGALVITEMMADPSAVTDASGEWFEITNTSLLAFDVNGLGLKGSGSTVNVVQSADCITVAPGGFALFARTATAATNGMLPAVDATFSFGLTNSNSTVSVLDGMTVLDAVTWTTSSAGASASLDPDKTTTTDNDLPSPTAGTWCPGTTVFGAGDKGTPKAANPQCP